MSALRTAFLGALFVLFLSIVPYSLAADADSDPGPQSTSAQQATSIPVNNKTWNAEAQTSFTFTNLMETGITTITGVCYESSCPKKTYDGKTTKLALYPNGVDQGALGALTGTMAMLYSPPTSTAYYLANLGDNLGIGPKTAYAQVTGSGEGIIAPVLGLWKVTRNLAYLFFILVFMVVGFMIMFRAKINPQTVISAQAALPNLVIGLVLVTFSYFIAALIVDLAFVGIHLVTWLFIQSGLNNSLGTPDQLQGFAQNANVFNLFGASAFNWNNMSTIQSGISGQISTSAGGPGLSTLLATIAGAIAGAIALPPWGALIGGGLGLVAIPAIIPFLVILVLVLGLFVQMFRLVFALLGAYISILVSTLGGPLVILVGSIPGRGNAISGWLKSLIANILIFPAVFGAFLFAGVILGKGNPGWSNTTLPLLGGVNGDFIRVLIAYGILLGSPAIPDTVKSAFGVKDQNLFGQAAIKGLTGGVDVARTGFNTLTGPLQAERKAYSDALIKYRAGAAEGLPREPASYEFWKWLGNRRPRERREGE